MILKFQIPIIAISPNNNRTKYHSTKYVRTSLVELQYVVDAFYAVPVEYF